jgi:hypothetical protein
MVASIPTVGRLPAGFRDRVRSHTYTQLHLCPDGDGWALLASDGEVVFRAGGIRGRQRCLRFARAHGVLTVVS